MIKKLLVIILIFFAFLVFADELESIAGYISFNTTGLISHHAMVFTVGVDSGTDYDYIVSSAYFKLYKYVGSPPGPWPGQTVYATIYNATGTVGVDGKPYGNPLATSSTIIAADDILPDGETYVFRFSDTPIRLKSGNKYAVVINTTSNVTTEGAAEWDPNGIDYHGNLAYSNNGVSWTSVASTTKMFYYIDGYRYYPASGTTVISSPIIIKGNTHIK